MSEKEEKKRIKSSPICFRNFFINYEKGGELSKMVGASGNLLRKPPARLCELGGNLLPIFLYK